VPSERRASERRRCSVETRNEKTHRRGRRVGAQLAQRGARRALLLLLLLLSLCLFGGLGGGGEKREGVGVSTKIQTAAHLSRRHCRRATHAARNQLFVRAPPGHFSPSRSRRRPARPRGARTPAAPPCPPTRRTAWRVSPWRAARGARNLKSESETRFRFNNTRARAPEGEGERKGSRAGDVQLVAPRRMNVSETDPLRGAGRLGIGCGKGWGRREEREGEAFVSLACPSLPASSHAPSLRPQNKRHSREHTHTHTHAHIQHTHPLHAD
jgi:hypothetical protein